jgi:hypothetical protein
MSRSLTASSCWVNLVERSHSSFALTVVCRFLPFPSFDDAVGIHQWKVQALSVGFRTGARCRCRVVEECFHLQGYDTPSVTVVATLFYSTSNV